MPNAPQTTPATSHGPPSIARVLAAYRRLASIFGDDAVTLTGRRIREMLGPSYVILELKVSVAHHRLGADFAEAAYGSSESPEEFENRVCGELGAYFAKRLTPPTNQ